MGNIAPETLVEIHGLEKDNILNGKFGYVVKYSDRSNRYVVNLIVEEVLSKKIFGKATSLVNMVLLEKKNLTELSVKEYFERRYGINADTNAKKLTDLFPTYLNFFKNMSEQILELKTENHDLKQEIITLKNQKKEMGNEIRQWRIDCMHTIENLKETKGREISTLKEKLDNFENRKKNKLKRKKKSPDQSPVSIVDFNPKI